MLKNCRICRKNAADSYEAAVFAAPGRSVISKAYLHQWEEPCISGTRGSGAVFFSGCNMKCVFCQNHYISQMSPCTLIGKRISAGRLADIFMQLQDQGAHNINLVSPTPYAPHIIEQRERQEKRLSVRLLQPPMGRSLRDEEALKVLLMLTPRYKYMRPII